MANDIKDIAHAVDAAGVMRLFASPPRVLALGEPTHGVDAPLLLRNALFRQLVEREGYRTIAIESDSVAGLLVDSYVATGSGTLDEAMGRGFSHGFGASAANRELVDWMRAFNEGRPSGDRVRFAGFDGPLEMAYAASPREALTSLHRFLGDHVDPDLLPCTAATLDRLLGADDRWTDTAAMLDPSASFGRSAEAGRLRLLADDLGALLDAWTPHLIAVASRDAFDRALMYARAASGLLRYHYWMADASPSRLARLTGLRDQMMAGNLLALAERGPVLAHAHNGHLQRDISSLLMGGRRLEWWSAGAVAEARLGEGYGFLATAFGTLRHQGVGVPPPETLEGALYALPEESCLVDAAELAAVLGAPGPVPRTSPYFGYAPLDPAHLARVDGVVFMKDVPEDRRTPPTP
ncbi:erythromycin esterase [Streptomyces sp. SID4928]|uniref:erythromycin esterase family protein n=1 Tax=unclassified Streptomyces TaxID=2593676 RepID=UPI0001C19105|nr:erythromycin esterase family protein [Streptomyces sp. ACT-1]EGE39916.1 Erythromycin esterase [Streptomyces sp. ACT-1]MYR47998.1 erythromycin esterase [Streptomyces sp. SID4928]